MRLLVLGGSFNPVHIGHLIMAEEARAEFGYDLVLLVPSLRPPHKERRRTSPGPSTASQMLRLAVGDDDVVGLDVCEIERGGTSYTIDTLEDLRSRYPIEGKTRPPHRRRPGPGLPFLAQARGAGSEAGRLGLRPPVERGGAAFALSAPLRPQQPRSRYLEQHGPRAHRRGQALQAAPRTRASIDYIVENGLYGLR